MKGNTKKIRFGITLNLLAATSLFFMLSLTAAPVSAIPMNATATLRFDLAEGTESYSGATTIIIGSTTTPEFNLYNNGKPVTGVGHLGVLVPSGIAYSFGVNVGEGPMTIPSSIDFSEDDGKLGDALGVAGLTDYQFAALASASAQVGITVSLFDAYNVTLGPYNPGIVDISFTGSLPTGTVIVAWVQSTSELDNALVRTPLSESLTVNTIPEPSTLLLLGAGLLGFGILGRRKFRS